MDEIFTPEERAIPLSELVWRERLARRRADKLQALSDECGTRRWSNAISNLAIRAHTRAERLAALIAEAEVSRG